MALRQLVDHDYDIVTSHMDQDMIETPSKPSSDGILSFIRDDGATVKCVVYNNNLELVIVEFRNGKRMEIEPMFVDEEMLKKGLGDQMPAIH